MITICGRHGQAQSTVLGDHYCQSLNVSVCVSVCLQKQQYAATFCLLIELRDFWVMTHHQAVLFQLTETGLETEMYKNTETVLRLKWSKLKLCINENKNKKAVLSQR